jgi:hypothetical protein
VIHRILEGPRVLEVGWALFVSGQSFLKPRDMQPTFPNRCRVFSKLDVVTPEQQHAFDTTCQEIGLHYGGVIVRHDVGSYLGFPGREYSLESIAHSQDGEEPED